MKNSAKVTLMLVLPLSSMDTIAVWMVFTFDAMHDEEWTQRAVMGWEMELGKLEKTIRERK